ncbi:cytochrome c biogenesis protein CcsA [Fibrobacterota bacterium]
MTKAYYILFFHVLGLYVLTSVMYWQLFFKEETRLIVKSRILLYSSVASHTLLLLLIALTNHRCPVATPGEGLLFCAWMVALGHLTSEFYAKSKPWGIFTLLPITLAVLLSLFLSDPHSPSPEQYRGAYFSFHIVSSLAAFACFTISAVLATMYITLFKRLKSKRFDVVFRTLPPLENIEVLETIWVYFGILFMIIAPVIGWIWVRDHGGEGMSPKEFGIFTALFLFLGTAIARAFFRFKGIRFAVSIIVGFGLLLMTLALNVHGF